MVRSQRLRIVPSVLDPVYRDFARYHDRNTFNRRAMRQDRLLKRGAAIVNRRHEALLIIHPGDHGAGWLAFSIGGSLVSAVAPVRLIDLCRCARISLIAELVPVRRASMDN